MQTAPVSDAKVRDCRRKLLKLRARKEFYRSQMKSRLREEYFEQQDIMHIEAQLSKSQLRRPIPDDQASWIPSMPERAELVSVAGSADMKSPNMLESRIAAVQAMADLCRRVEPVKRSSKKPTNSSPHVKLGQPEDANASAAPTTTDDPFPIWCNKLQCLFCIGDERLALEDRIRRYGRLQALWSHAKNHLCKLTASDISCPGPRCKPQAVVLKSVEHLLNHAQQEHNIRLRSR